jgi:hypothetical protein
LHWKQQQTGHGWGDAAGAVAYASVACSRPLLVVMLQYGDLRTLKPSDNRLFPDSNGSIIAASYEARAFGVKRLVHLTLHAASPDACMPFHGQLITLESSTMVLLGIAGT